MAFNQATCCFKVDACQILYSLLLRFPVNLLTGGCKKIVL